MFINNLVIYKLSFLHHLFYQINCIINNQYLNFVDEYNREIIARSDAGNRNTVLNLNLF